MKYFIFSLILIIISFSLFAVGLIIGKRKLKREEEWRARIMGEDSCEFCDFTADGNANCTEAHKIVS